MEHLKLVILENRKKLNMTQKELASKINVSDKVVSKWETGASYPDITIINDLASALEIDVTTLLNVKNVDYKNKEEEIDEKIIRSFKLKHYISMALIIVVYIGFAIAIGMLITFRDDLNSKPYIVIASVLIVAVVTTIIPAALILYFINNNSYKNKISKSIYFNYYEKVYYKNQLIFIDVILGIPIVLIPLLLHYPNYLLIIIIVSILFKLLLINKTKLRFRNKKNLIILIAAYLLILPLMLLNKLLILSALPAIFFNVIYYMLTSIGYYYFKHKE